MPFIDEERLLAELRRVYPSFDVEVTRIRRGAGQRGERKKKEEVWSMEWGDAGKGSMDECSWMRWCLSACLSICLSK